MIRTLKMAAWEGRSRSALEYLGLWAVLLACAALVGIYALLVPAFEGPDAGAHFRYVAYLSRQRVLPAVDLQTAAISHELVQQPPLYYALAAVLTPPSSIEPALELESANPYYTLGLSKRGTVTLPGTAAGAALWIARLVSALGALLAVLGTWGLARLLFPGSPTAALAAASLVAFNPQFLFSAASITNDTWAAATAVLTMWAAFHLVRQDGCRPAAWLGLGSMVGIASLAKTSNLAILLPVAFLIVPALWRSRWKRGVLQAALCVIGFSIAGGWWYGRYLVRYGAVIPLGPMLGALPGLAREQAAGASEIWRQVQWLPKSYWGVFGYGVLAQPWYYKVTSGAMLLGGVGALVYTVRMRRHAASPDGVTLIALGTWLGAVMAGLASWMRIVLYADQGRLLFPAAGAVAVLLVVGWQGLCPRPLWLWLHSAVMALCLALAVSQIATLREAYRVPQAITGALHMDRPLAVDFDQGMSLVGIDMPAGAGLARGRPMPITLYFRASHEIHGFYTLFIHLADDKNRMIWQFDGVPVGGLHPTRQWLPGQIFADSYLISADNIAEDGLAVLSAGFYAARNPAERQSVRGGADGDDRVILAQVRLHALQDAANVPAPSPLASWPNGIQLAEAKIDKDRNGSPHVIRLRWESLAPIQDNYTVSVQFLDGQGKLLAQVDQEPQAGRYPTSTWRAGDSIDDQYAFDQVPAGWRRLIVLLYDRSAKRLPLAGPGPAADYVELTTGS